MATDLDELQLVITSNSNEAAEAIDKLVKGLEGLNTALGNLDASKVNSFASSMGKLANIGANTNVTAKAVKSLSQDLAQSFNIKTKKGVEDITVAMQALYSAARNLNLNDSLENGEIYLNSVKNLQKAIEANYQYKQSVDSTTKSIAEYVRAQNQSGRKVAMGDMAEEYGEDFKNLSKVLGKSFKNTLKSTEGAQDLAEFFNDMNSVLNTDFKTGSLAELRESVERLKVILENSKGSVLDFSQAVSQGLLTGEEAATSALNVAEKIFALVKEQSKYGASDGLTGLAMVFKEISQVQMPDFSQMADVLKMMQNASTNLSKAAPSINEATNAMDSMAASVDKTTNAVNELNTALVVASQNSLAKIDFTTSLQSIEHALPAVREFSNFQPPDLSTAIEYFNEYAEAIHRALGAILQLEEHQKRLTDKYYDPIDTSGEWVENNPPDMYTAVDAYTKMEKAAQGASHATKRLSDNIKLLTDNIPIDTTGEWVEDLEKAASSMNTIPKNMKVSGDERPTRIIAHGEMPELEPTTLAEVAEKLLVIGECFERLSETFGSLAEKGTKLFKILISPLKYASEEYVEKFKSMGESVANFQKNFKAHMKKVSDFWKRTMRTFTFMIVRKAFTAILKEVGTAVQSLALYSNAMGTAFNTDLSNMVADFQYLGRSIVSVFAPLLNFIAPIIDAITSRIATLLSYIGMLFTALGGGTSFTKAKKSVGNYAESLDKANKSAKNLTMGIDELNIISENKSGGSSNPYDGWEDAWEQIEIPDWIKDLADKLKNIFKDLFEPMKRAWNLAKDYVLDGWKFMTKNMKKLLQDVWRDFIRVWKGDTVTHIFYNLLMILGDIERVIGFIAKRFDEAWNEGEKGYKILSNIASIVDILVQHLRNVTLYMVGWASRLDFNPLLESFEYLTRSLTDLAEFVGQVFEDIMKRVVLKYLNFLIEEGLPHLQHTIAETLTYFDFGAIREKLRPIEDAFEELLENLDIGKTEAIGNLGKMIAEFTDSEDFQNFLNTIQHMMETIDAETVEKILTGIGMGIGHIAEALVKFFGSESFNAFIDDLGKWFKDSSPEDIARILERLAKAIAMFKFAEFATAGFAKFFTFAGLLKSFKDIGTISANLQALSASMGAVGVEGAAAGTGGTAAAGGLSAVAAPAAVAAAVIAAVVAAVYSLIKSFGGLDGFIMRIRESFERVSDTLKKVAEHFKFGVVIDALKASISRLGDKLGSLNSYWDMVLRFIELVVSRVGLVLIPVFEALAGAVTVVIDIVSTLVDVFGGVAEMIQGVLSFDLDKIAAGGKHIGDAIVEGVKTGLTRFSGAVSEESDAAVEEASKGAKRVAGTYAQDYSTEIQSLEGLMKDSNTAAINNAITGIDLTSASDTFANMTVMSLSNSVTQADYSDLTNAVSGAWSNSLTNGKETFDTANAETASSGAESFSSEYVNSFSSNTSINDALMTTGMDAANAFNTGMQNGLDSQTVNKTIQDIFKQINETSKTCIATLKSNLATNFGVMISTLDFMTSFTTLFNRITETVTTNINNLGSNLSATVFPSFMDTYILPLFSAEMWQPYFDTLLNDVFMVAFEDFGTWFNEQAMTPFWNENVLIWFEKEKWDKDIFNPLSENIHSHFDTFILWWDESMSDWWDNHVVVWFDETKWKTQFNVILNVAKKVFEQIKTAIKTEMDAAAEAVSSACESMASAIADIITAIGEMMDALDGFEGFEGKVTFDFGTPTGYATGGFPQEGTLFYAGERGAEFVSSVNGRTGVVSNGEITGIADAVYATGNTESELLAQLISIGQAMLNKDPVVLGDKELAMAVDRGKNRMGMTIIT